MYTLIGIQCWTNNKSTSAVVSESDQVHKSVLTQVFGHFYAICDVHVHGNIYTFHMNC